VFAFFGSWAILVMRKPKKNWAVRTYVIFLFLGTILFTAIALGSKSNAD